MAYDGSELRADLIAHGTHSKYVHDKCRCESCRDAEKRYQREYREANGERLRAYDRRPERDTRLRDDPAKRRARQRAKDNLPARPCEECGADNAQRHHEDYDRPLDVRWLCPSCHGIAHRKRIEAQQLSLLELVS